MSTTLYDHAIVVDSWTRNHPRDFDYFLTHMHSDHLRIPKSFGGRHVWVPAAIQTLGVVIPGSNVRYLTPGIWYHTEQSATAFTVFAVYHTFESLGVWFPALGVVYVGDGYIPDPVIQSLAASGRLHTVVYDALLEGSDLVVPCHESGLRLLRAFGTSGVQTLECVHHGILQYLQTHLAVRWRLHTTVAPLTRDWARLRGMEDPESPYLLVGKTYTGKRILPSLLWFAMEPLTRDPCVVHEDGDKYRVFCQMHPSRAEILDWKRRLPRCVFECLASNPLFRAPPMESISTTTRDRSGHQGSAVEPTPHQ
jgi:hypothetical protein